MQRQNLAEALENGLLWIYASLEARSASKGGPGGLPPASWRPVLQERGVPKARVVSLLVNKAQRKLFGWDRDSMSLDITDLICQRLTLRVAHVIPCSHPSQKSRN